MGLYDTVTVDMLAADFQTKQHIVRERFAEEGIDLPVDTLAILRFPDPETGANWDVPLTPEQERQDSRARKVIQEARAEFPNMVPSEQAGLKPA